MWELSSWPGIEPESPALEGGFLTTGPPGKSLDPVYLIAENLYPLPVSPYFLTPQRSRRFKNVSDICWGKSSHCGLSGGPRTMASCVRLCFLPTLQAAHPASALSSFFSEQTVFWASLGHVGWEGNCGFHCCWVHPTQRRGGPLINPGLGHSASLLVQPEGLPLNRASQTVLCIRITCEALKTPISPSHPRPITSGPQGTLHQCFWSSFSDSRVQSSLEIAVRECLSLAISPPRALGGQSCLQLAQSRVSSARWGPRQRQATGLPAACPPNPTPCRAQCPATPAPLPQAPALPNQNRRPEFRARWRSPGKHLWFQPQSC